MASRTENQHSYPQPYPKKRKRRRRRNEQFVINATAYLIVAALFIGGGAALWKGMQIVWSEIQGVLESIKPDDSVISFHGTAPSESTGGDTTAPVLSGITDFTIYQGNTVAYLSGVTVTDETDPNPTITVDSSAVDLSQPGEYQVVYTATDASGNTSQATAVVVVLKNENFVELDIIYAAADAKLEEIIRKNATVKQQIHDIYAWARLNLTYSGHSDRADWQQTAYVMLTEGKGDCFGFYAVTKLLFERLEIPNIDVRKIKNSDADTDHFWSLVSLDGGETWYHFDATPRAGEGDDFCLVTDAFIDAYSKSHDGSHNRDKSLYPETP